MGNIESNTLCNLLHRWCLIKFESNGRIADVHFKEIYDQILPTIKVMVRGNKLFIINRLSNEDLEEISNDIVLKIHDNIENIYSKGIDQFYPYLKKMIYNYIHDALDLKKKAKGELPIYIQFPESITDTLPDDGWQSKIINLERKKNNLYKYLIKKEIDTILFQHITKWIDWAANINVNDSCTIIQRTNLNRTGFTLLEYASSKVYQNPLSLITRYDLWLNNNPEDRYYMRWAIDEMKKSKEEKDTRREKIDPMVGAVLVDSHGYVICSSFRGMDEEQNGHCEYNLLENVINHKYIKRRYIVDNGKPGAGARVTEINIDDARLYVTLEPCSCRKNNSCYKCPCADRIIYSGIKTVYIGLKDPDKTVNGSGIKKLEDAGITIKYFHQDLLFEIIKAKNQNGEQQNLKFIISKKEFYLKEQPELFINSILKF